MNTSTAAVHQTSSLRSIILGKIVPLHKKKKERRLATALHCSYLSLHCLRAITALPVASLLLDLQAINHRRQLAQDLISLLVVFELSSNEVCKVAKGLGGIKDLQHIIQISPFSRYELRQEY